MQLHGDEHSKFSGDLPLNRHNHGNKHGYAHDITDVQILSLGIDVAKFLSEKDAGLEIRKLPEGWAAIPRENLCMFQQGQG
jgi:hypothetical protein